MLIKIIYIATGGAIGSSLRFVITDLFKSYFPYFPIGTLFINILGSFLIGLFANYLNNRGIPEIILRYFIIIGLLGSFTTFSAFSFETLELIKEGKISSSLLYILLSFILSITAAFVGFSLPRI